MLLRTLFRWAALLGLCSLSVPVAALEISWQRMPGKGKDISVGADGSVFVVGSGDGNEPLYRWNGTAWENRGGSAVLVAVGPAGDPWALDKYSNLAHFTDGQWQPVVQNGSVTDVSVGTNGTVYVVGGAFCNCGKVFNEKIYRLDGTNFVASGVSGVVVHPDPAGVLWSVDASTAIHRSASSGSTTTITGHALDLSISAKGDIWIISRSAFDGYDGDVQVWNGTEFVSAGQFGSRIAVAPDGTPWVITDDNRIYRGRPIDLRIADAQAVEGQSLVFPITLTAPAQKLVTVGYRLVAPPATVGTNSPMVVSGQITLNPGQTNASIAYQVPNDTVYLGTRLYTLEVTNAVGANPPSTPSYGRVTDDEPVPPTLRATTALAVLEGQTLEFPLSLLPAAPADVVVSYQVFGATNAPATNQGVLGTGTVILAAGSTTGTIHFLSRSNSVAEPDQNYRLEILSAPGAVVQVATATGPVLDDDAGDFTVAAVMSTSTEGSRLQARVQSRASFEYTLERRLRLTGNEGWAPLVALTGSGGEIVLADTTEPGLESYYRITARRRQ